MKLQVFFNPESRLFVSLLPSLSFSKVYAVWFLRGVEFNGLWKSFSGCKSSIELLWMFQLLPFLSSDILFCS